MKSVFSALTLFFSVFLISANLAAETVLVINNTNNSPYTNSEKTGYLDFIISRAFKQVGVKHKLEIQPPERGLLNANSGQIDGDLTRIYKIGELYPNLVRVEEPLINWEFAAFSNNQEAIANNKLDDKYFTGFIKGWKIYEAKTSGMKNTLNAQNPEQLFRLFKLNRADTILYEYWQGLALLRKLNITDRKVHSQILEKKKMYLYLNKKHKELAIKLAEVLRQLKKNGTYDYAYRTYLLPYQVNEIE